MHLNIYLIPFFKILQYHIMCPKYKTRSLLNNYQFVKILLLITPSISIALDAIPERPL